jgi:hypothetical protein
MHRVNVKLALRYDMPVFATTSADVFLYGDHRPAGTGLSPVPRLCPVSIIQKLPHIPSYVTWGTDRRLFRGPVEKRQFHPTARSKARQALYCAPVFIGTFPTVLLQHTVFILCSLFNDTFAVTQTTV